MENFNFKTFKLIELDLITGSKDFNFYFGNGSFAHDVEILLSNDYLKPRKIVEVGSGHSTLNCNGSN